MTDFALYSLSVCFITLPQGFPLLVVKAQASRAVTGTGGVSRPVEKDGELF